MQQNRSSGCPSALLFVVLVDCGRVNAIDTSHVTLFVFCFVPCRAVCCKPLLFNRSACNTVVPKLVSQDYALFASLLDGVFPGCQVPVSGLTDVTIIFYFYIQLSDTSTIRLSQRRFPFYEHSIS